MRHGTPNLMAKMAAEEAKFLRSPFLSPVLSRFHVRVRMAGVVVDFAITPPSFEGWGIFNVTSPRAAHFSRHPTMSERRQYLDLFPALRLIICARQNEAWLGIPAKDDRRFKISGLVPIRLAKDVQLFDTVVTRYDGSQCWFDEQDGSANLSNARFLREALATELSHGSVIIPGMTPQEKDAYAVAFARTVEEKRDKSEERIRSAIERAGGKYQSYLDRGDSYLIEYRVDGENHRSVVGKDLSVVSAGICLNHGDAAFDLQSLVTVISEGIRERKIHHVPIEDPDDDDE